MTYDPEKLVLSCGHDIPEKMRSPGPYFCTECPGMQKIYEPPTPVLPLPNETVTTSAGVDEKVVASIWQNDDAEFGPIFALLLTLAPKAPYYRVREITWSGERWDCNNVQEFPNIVPATAAYVENGGDY